MDNKAMYKLSYGLFVLSVKDGEKDNGCITNTAIQVTTEPNQIAFAVNKLNHTHDLLISSGVFNISILSEKADFDLFKRFGFQSGRDVDKFEGFSGYERAENGIVYISEGTNAYISGKVVKTVELSTHTLFIAEVTEAKILDDAPSATYDYYQKNIKQSPASNENLKPEQKGKTVWRCKICGYVYEGESLPDDFVCPWCKHPASDFERVEA